MSDTHKACKTHILYIFLHKNTDDGYIHSPHSFDSIVSQGELSKELHSGTDRYWEVPIYAKSVYDSHYTE